MKEFPPIFSQLGGDGEEEYVWLKTWIVRKDIINAPGIWHSIQHIPGLRKKIVLNFLYNTQFNPAARLRLPFSFDAVQIIDNGFRARGFLLGQGKTVKTVYRHSRYGENTERELCVRTGILKGSRLSIPKIYAHQANDDYVRFEEEMVRGRIYSHWRDSRFFEDQVSVPLMEIAEKAGVEQRPLSDSIDAALRDVVLQSTSNDPAVTKGKALLELNPLVAACFTHGDLVSSNMIVSRGRVYLVDWDRNGYRYAGYDQARVAMKYPWNPHYAAAAKTAFERYQSGRFTLEQAGAIRAAVAAARAHIKPQK